MTASHRASIDIESTGVLLSLTGPHAHLLVDVARATGAEVGLRGNTIHLAGSEADVTLAHRFLKDAAVLVGRGVEIRSPDVGPAVQDLRADPRATLRGLLDEVIAVSPKKRPVVPKTAAQRDYVRRIRRHDLTFGIGPAGTGKTHLAMACAASDLLARKVKRIILTRPAVEAGERLGFLPGDLAEKVNPYLRPLYDALHDMIDYEKVEILRERQQIEVAPLAFMRGRTLNDCFVILDEAQNSTSEQMRMFLTRLGYGSRAVVTGDITQVDLPSGTRSGLREARDLLEGIDGIAFQRFGDADVVRHPLVQKIIVAYEQHDERQAEERAARKAARELARGGGRGSPPGDREAATPAPGPAPGGDAPAARPADETASDP